MSCGCLKNIYAEKSKIEKQAIKESGLDKTDYIVYEIEGKTTYDKKSCWIKSGKKGKIKSIIFFI